MREKKWVIIISSMIIVLSLIIFTIVLSWGNRHPYSYSSFIEWTKTVSAGTLTSAMVTLLITTVEYFVEKKKSLQEFMDATFELIVQYRTIEVIDTDIPIDILKSYFREEMWNNTVCYKSAGTARQIALNYIRNKHLEFSSNPIEDDQLTSLLSKHIQHDRDHLYYHIQHYLELVEKVKSTQLATAYSNIDFLYSHNSTEWICKEIVRRQVEAQKRLCDLAFHLRNFLETERSGHRGNLSVMISKMLEIQDFFLLTIHDYSGFHTVVINKFVFNMDWLTHLLMKSTYGKKYIDIAPEEKEYIIWGRYLTK